MPLLNRNTAVRKLRPPVYAYDPAAGGRGPAEILPAARERAPATSRLEFFGTCANPCCGSGWLKLWRIRRTPVFEGGWCCSSACTRAQVESALSREMGARGHAPEIHRRRIPLGMAMLEQGWITVGQLREALEAQQAAGAGRLGQWLVRQRAASEELLTRALGLQWSCPVLGVEYRDAEAMTALLPRLFVDTLGCLPLRVTAGKILYLGFEDRPDPVLALAVERMTGLRVEVGLVQGSVFRLAHARMLAARYPHAKLIEPVSEMSRGNALLKAMARVRPAEARLVRVHDRLWLRLWLRPQMGVYPERESVEDLICSSGGR